MAYMDEKPIGYGWSNLSNNQPPAIFVRSSPFEFWLVSVSFRYQIMRGVVTTMYSKTPRWR